MKALGLLGQIDLPGETASVPKARHYLRVLLAGTGHPHCDDALLLTTELVANAVRHTDSARPGGRVTIAAALRDGTLHIDVIDAGSAVNKPEIHPGDDIGMSIDVDQTGDGGRGLWLVRELATTWGWHDTGIGRVVWFQLATD
ncbi:ATP-binding protein [Sphaerimonospora thailandensis]|uniref:ATP-binding protein n=1 Tax=Sphaerimonospora thailandensis TaxID=795644 RepID=A0A8J3R2N5_9ACTN|nr:ATP-binding protein [Sphaerimonospora thailandensis]GIH68021.1 ATP-binding protein [Sphaerimonospora thailandensis]